ncbi:hypothetical protein ACRTEP_21280 [Vibrio diabolicus]|uniref:hypothetical protein n=1 Tax=Vibrio diabolicus TaxID=50719 RepID=UPI003D7CC674
MMYEYDADIDGLDMETGGLDGYQEIEGVGRVHGAMYYPIIEIAVVLPLVEGNGTLNIEKGNKLVVGIEMTEEREARCDPWALKQHTESGLLDRLKTGEGFDFVAKTTEEAEQHILQWLQDNGSRKFNHKESTGAMVYGNNVGFDMNFLNAQMPALYEHFSYRKIDVSTINVLSRTPIWRALCLPQPKKVLAHTALSDITETTDELNAYTNAMPTIHRITVGEPMPLSDDVIVVNGKGDNDGH